MRKLCEIEISVFINKFWLENSHACVFKLLSMTVFWGGGASQVRLSGRESSCQCWRHRFNPWTGKIPWRRRWQPTPVFLPGKPHGQRGLAGCSPRGWRSQTGPSAAQRHGRFYARGGVEWVRQGLFGAQTLNIHHLSLCRKKIYWPCFQAKPTADHIPEKSQSSLCFRMGQIMQRQVSEWT